MIYAEPEWLAGSIDFVAQDGAGNFHIFDWKRSKNLPWTQWMTSPHGRMRSHREH
jgi:hypothetical protein